MSGTGVLAVLRGNSGSGKSTVARMVQERFGRAECLVVSQDRVRRDMLRERDVAGGANVGLLRAIADWGLARGLVVVVEGILSAGRYERMLEELRGRASAAHFFAWDLSFAETVRRHAERPQRVLLGPDGRLVSRMAATRLRRRGEVRRIDECRRRSHTHRRRRRFRPRTRGLAHGLAR